MSNQGEASAAVEPAEDVEVLDAVIVGAGWSGMYMLHRLRGQGLRARIYEAGGGVGGTWFWNRYPGARCDGQSLEYEYSWADEVWRKWEWTEKYAAQPEIERYANHVAEVYDLRRDITLNTRVRSAVFDDATGPWTIETSTGSRVRARFAVMAAGGYSVPLKPGIPGLDSFAGETLYTAKWPDREVDVSGKRVAVIGTGSSGMQVVSALGKDPEFDHLHVFQRTANFGVRAYNGPMDPEYQRDFRERHDELWEQILDSGAGTLVVGPAGPVADIPYDEFRTQMDELWRLGGPTVLNCISDMVTSEKANARVADYIRDRIRDRVDDPTVAEKLCPKGYHLGAKRLLVEDGYFEVYNHPNVTLVDLHETPLAEVTPRGIRTSAGHIDVDILIMATGFDSATGALAAIDIRGRGGRRFADKWRHGPTSYLGATVEGFPNMFVIAGPGSPSIRSNVMVSIEQHVEWVSDLIEHMTGADLAVVEASPEAERSWTQHVVDAVDGTLMARDDTQYVGANVPGKPRVYLAYVGGVKTFRAICDRVRAAGYEGLLFGRADEREPICSSRTWSGPPTGPGFQTRFGSQLGSPVI